MSAEPLIDKWEVFVESCAKLTSNIAIAVPNEKIFRNIELVFKFNKKVLLN